jgi:arabinogalactan endo-1,4-beta-galactosidase
MKNIFYICIAMAIFMTKVNADIYKGVDLSYVNELEDCNATYYDGGIAKDPYQIMADHGANIVRVRLWHDPLARSTGPSVYSGYDDVVKSIQRAKNNGMRVMLDFHYSDNWTDPGEQEIPHAWAHLASNTPALATEVYDYTYKVLTDLDAINLMPELVQVGNEINGNILSASSNDLYPVDFTRQATLLNAGISAVRAAGELSSIKPKTILHIADPNKANNWFSNITANIDNYDIIGLSYYPEWHAGSVSDIGNIITSLKNTYNKEVMIVEVGAPWTSDYKDSAANMLSVLPTGYGQASINGQRNFLEDLANEVYTRGGYGLVYWEPSWISTPCDTQWGTGSHWENATFFDFNNNVIEDGGITYLAATYGDTNLPSTSDNVTFRVDMNNTSATEAYITGNFTGESSWEIIAMTNEGAGIFSYSANITTGSVGGYFFLSNNDWATRETVPTACALQWSDREYSISSGENLFAYTWESCEPLPNVTFRVDMSATTSTTAYITGSFTDNGGWQIIPMTDEGNNIFSYSTYISEGTIGAYYFLESNDWSSREVVPTSCALQWGTDRQYNIASGENLNIFDWASCQ